MKDKIDQIVASALQAIGDSAGMQELEQCRVAWLGKKSDLHQLQKTMGSLSAKERPKAGALLNEARKAIQSSLDSRREELESAALEERLRSETIDVTLPGRTGGRGRRHPVSLVSRQIFDIFEKMGFTVLEGPEVEEEFYNFDALNIPPHHPAREDQDSFYISDDRLLRTQTSGMQIRTFKRFKPPVAAISPGKCFRKDTVDATHSHTFHQVEGFLVDKGVSMADLKGVLTGFVHQMFGADTRVRFRPDFFPFTEPSAEIAISCFNCGGKGCRVCSSTGWIEIGGAGMIHPEVFKSVGYDYETYSGFAFGMGIERIVMKKYGVSDIRQFYENDVRFLSQF